MRVFRISSKIGSFLKLLFLCILLFITYKVIESTDQEVTSDQSEEPAKKAEVHYDDFEEEKVVKIDEKLDRAVLPKRDHSKLKFPHIEGNEIALEDQHQQQHEEKKKPKVSKNGPRGAEMINGKVILGRGVDLGVPLPIYLPKSRLGNYEVEIDRAGHTGPGEFGVPVKTEPEEKAHVDEVIKEFGFNLVNSDKISLDRLVVLVF